jgi:hypothetical protein
MLAGGATCEDGEGVALYRAEPAEQGGVEGAGEGDGTGDSQLVVLAAEGEATEINVEGAGGCLGVPVGNREEARSAEPMPGR